MAAPEFSSRFRLPSGRPAAALVIVWVLALAPQPRADAYVLFSGPFPNVVGATSASISKDVLRRDPDDNEYVAGSMRGSASTSAWSIHAASNFLSVPLDFDEDGKNDSGALGTAVFFTTLHDNFTVTDVTDPANPILTGSMGATLFMNIRINGSLGVFGGGGAVAFASFRVDLLGASTGFGSPRYGGAQASLSLQTDGSFNLFLDNFSLPSDYTGAGLANFDDVLRVNLCTPDCPQLGTPFTLRLQVGVGAGVQGQADPPTTILAESDFGNSFSIGFEWDDSTRKFAIASEGGYSNVAPIPVPAALPLLVSALGLRVWRRAPDKQAA